MMTHARTIALGRKVARPASHSASPSLLTRLSVAAVLWRERRALARLDAARLKDLGLTARDVAREQARPLWDAPDSWRC